MPFKILIPQRYYALGDSQKELIFNQGQMIDASFTLAPRQRNTRQEKAKIRARVEPTYIRKNIKL